MATSAADLQYARESPLELVERVVHANGLAYERFGAEDMAAEVAGRWCSYQLWFTYRPDLEAMHFACGFDMRVPPARRAAIYPLLALINERLWLGHFDLWTGEGQPTWRHSLLFRGALAPSEAQVEDMVGFGVSECERFYPAFQHVIWAGRSAEEALSAALVETVGEA